MTQPWQPFDMSDDEAAEYEALVPGVPDWLRGPLLNWIETVLAGKDPTGIAPVFEAQAALRLNLYAGQISSNGWAPRSRMWPNVEVLSERDLLRFADWLLAHRPHGSWNRWLQGPDSLEKVLRAARSKWTVGNRNELLGLVERVPEGARLAVEKTISEAGKAGAVLARAWSDVHGLEPDDSGAYWNAVKAVEIASIPIVVPKMQEATFGHVLGQMKADGDWSLPLRTHADAPGPDMVLSMGRNLWRGHNDRHGREDYADVTHEEARAAVMLAATLIEWFHSGALKRRP